MTEAVVNDIIGSKRNEQVSFEKTVFCKFLAALVLAAFVIMPSWGSVVYRDCFEILDYGSIKHVACTVEGLEGMVYSIDHWETNRWEAVIHGWGMDDSRIRNASVGEHYLDDNNMPSGVYSVTATAQPFAFEFLNWYSDGAAGSKTWYGYVVLSLNEKAELVILECAITDTQNYLLVDIPSPEEPVVEIEWQWKDCGDYIEIAGGQSEDVSGRIIIPPEINGKPVGSIGGDAFYNCSGITSVVIPETVSNIGDKAFCGCVALVSCNIPSGVTNIGYSAFAYTHLCEVVLPGGLKSITGQAFCGCESLTNAVIGSQVTNIGNMAFHRTAISSISIPASVQLICSEAFVGCENLERVGVWPWTKLQDNAFEWFCEIDYTGSVTNVNSFLKALGSDAVTNILAMIGAEYLNGVTEVCVFDEYPSDVFPQYALSKALYYIGVAPAVSTCSGGKLEAKYHTPKLEIMSFDPAKRKIKGRLIPQGGCRICSCPEEGLGWLLGLRCFDRVGSSGVSAWWLAPDVKYFADEESLGEFTYEIPIEDFSTNNFFRLELNL